MNAKSRIVHKQKRKIQSLQVNLSSTNDKRFKLQDAVGMVEKELQTAKAHINQLEMQAKAKYESGIPDTKYNDANNSPLYRQYRNT